MVQIDILEDIVVPESPRTVDNEQLFVYVPVATYDNKGIASFSSDDFTIENGKVMLRVRLSEFEKTLSNKLDKYDKGGKGSILYGVTDDGEQAMFLSDRLAIEDTITIRDENGNVKTNRPVENNDAINKFYGHNTFANALKGNVSGSAVAMNDISPLEHELDVKVSSKNLISTIYPDANVTIENGVVTQIEADTKEIIVFKIQYRSIEGTWHQEEIVLSTSDIGVLSIPFNIEHEIDTLRCGLNGSNFDSVVSFNLLPRGTYVFSCNITNLTQGFISWRDMQIEKGTVATPYAPYIEDISSVEVKRYGKNLLPTFDAVVTADGVTATFKDGYVTFTGALAEGVNSVMLYYLYPAEDRLYLPSGKYVMGGFNPSTNVYVSGYSSLEDDRKWVGDIYTSGMEMKNAFYLQTLVVYVTAECIGKTFPLIMKSGTTMFNASDEFEPYIEPTTYEVEADGSVNGVMPLYPSTTLITDNRAIIECEYNRDINKAFEELTQIILSLGGNI